jgi:hypothetical protein
MGHPLLGLLGRNNRIGFLNAAGSKLGLDTRPSLATVTVLWIVGLGAAFIPRAAVAPARAMARGSLREANFTKDLTPTDDPFLL